MRVSKVAFMLGVAVVCSAMALPGVSASASAGEGNDACTVLTAASFGRIMGYAATIDKTGSTKMSCFYKGPPHSGGQFTILSETASGPQADAMLNRRGSSPPPGSGLIGGSYRKGTVLFSVSVRSTDQSKLAALVAEVMRNLK